MSARSSRGRIIMRNATLALLLTTIIALWPGGAGAQTICDANAMRGQPIDGVDDLAGLYRDEMVEVDISPCGVHVAWNGQRGYLTGEYEGAYLLMRRVEDGGFV